MGVGGLILGLAIAALLPLLAAPAGAAEPLNIRIGWLLVPAEITPILFPALGIAKHMGASYVVQSTRFQGSSRLTSAMASGETDIAILATNAVGSIGDMALRFMLRRHDVNDAKDVSIVEIAFRNMNAVLAEGKADMIVSVLPFYLDPARQKDVDVQHELGFVKGPMDAKALVDMSLVEEAAKRLRRASVETLLHVQHPRAFRDAFADHRETLAAPERNAACVLGGDEEAQHRRIGMKPAQRGEEGRSDPAPLMARPHVEARDDERRRRADIGEAVPDHEVAVTRH
ncbi:MAG TPA: hypothetical protein VN802_12090 [Stellaceae bacterium]|nr:hypothetical protein [Stellaceae bacterium]